jgi:aspartate/methionine/tyrosine aminotransferase
MDNNFSSFRSVPKTGVIYVMTEALKKGFSTNRIAWANLGQGAPETGHIPGSPSRITNIPVSEEQYEYSPVGGLVELRQAVADLYNERYRKDKKSKYTYENVAIGSGGRLALTRIVSTLGSTHIGHFLPDYTAYEELLGSFGTFVPIPISLPKETNFELSTQEIEKEILGKGLSALLISNPGNPTGNVLKNGTLKSWVDLSRDLECAIIFDEFYSQYLYDTEELSISAAEYVDDVNSDPVIILDGLTKNWRYPGLRISWTIAPKPLIDACISAGSFLDGGASHPVQSLAIGLISKEQAELEAKSIKDAFQEKRDYICKELHRLGITCTPPKGAFYAWGNLTGLPESIRSGRALFEKCIDKNLIIVPGEFFDINPGKRRPKRAASFEHYARFSFGPPMEELKLGIKILEEVINTAK